MKKILLTLVLLMWLATPVMAEELVDVSVDTTATETITETFGGGIDIDTGESIPLETQTDITVTVNELPVSTTMESGVSLDEVYGGSFGMEEGYLNLQSPSSEVVITFPHEEKNITGFGFTVGAKNGESSLTITYTDETTEQALIDGTCCESEFNFSTLTNFIKNFIIPTDWDWWLLDNLYYVAEAQAEVVEPSPQPEISEEIQIEEPQQETSPQTPPTSYVPEPVPVQQPPVEVIVEQEELEVIEKEPVVQEVSDPIIEEEVIVDEPIQSTELLEEELIEESIEVLSDEELENIVAPFESPISIDVPEALVSIPLLGDAAVLITESVEKLFAVGSDMSPAEREESQKVIVAAVIVGQIANLSTIGVRRVV